MRDSLQYFTPSRIKIATPKAHGTGPVIVTTVEGGTGICLLTFTFETVVEDEADHSTTVGNRTLQHMQSCVSHAGL